MWGATAPSPPDNSQQPDQTRQTRGLRIHQLRQLPHPSPAICRQTQLGTARNPHSDLNAKSPLRIWLTGTSSDAATRESLASTGMASVKCPGPVWSAWGSPSIPSKRIPRPLLLDGEPCMRSGSSCWFWPTATRKLIRRYLAHEVVETLKGQQTAWPTGAPSGTTWPTPANPKPRTSPHPPTPRPSAAAADASAGYASDKLARLHGWRPVNDTIDTGRADPEVNGHMQPF